jgi:hypothetical protein
MRPYVIALVGSILAAACGGSALTTGTTDAGRTIDAPEVADAGGPDARVGAVDATSSDAAAADAGPTAMACIPGRSVACVGPGGCSSNQVCNGDGTGYGPCNCAPKEAGTSCIPGQSIACPGPGGCVASQVCDADGSGYGPCACTGDGGLVCVPGQSIACTGAGGCFSSQVCESDGMAYGPCVCFDGGSVECQTASDCENLLGPVPPLCTGACPPGSVVPEAGIWCLHYICVLGVCQTTYCG